MSARFWLFSMASAGAAVVGGISLGLYATTPPRVAYSDYEDAAATTEGQEEGVDGAMLSGPTDVRCTGCAPTLAQRQMATLMSGWDGYHDPVVRDYERQDIDMAEEPLADAPYPPTSPAHQLSPNVERFAAGEPAIPQPIRLVQSDGVATDIYVPARP